MKLRIAHIVPSLALDGATRQLTYLAKGLAAKGYDISVMALRATPSAVELMRTGNLAPVVLGWRGPYDAVGIWRLWREIRRRAPDLLHVWLPENGSGAPHAAAMASGRSRLAVSVRELAPLGDGLPAAYRAFAKRADRFVINAEVIRKAFVAEGIPASKLALIPDAAPEFEKSSISRHDLLAELRLPPDAKLIAYLGWLTKRKRLKELIWAIDQLKAVGTTAHLLMIGEGPARRALERYCWLNRVEDRVRFVEFRQDVSCFLTHVDVLWQAGTLEGSSNAVLEAMAAGIPVVAADAGGNRELVVAGETGFLVPLRERAGFARFTLPLLENCELATNLGTAGHKRVLQAHRMTDTLAAYAKLYEELCTR